MINSHLGEYYVIQKLIGEGGMALVYLGLDTRTNTPVAIKHVKPGLSDSNLLIGERFKREVQLLQKLQHPNIIDVFDVIEHENDEYLIMEYISGGTLYDHLKSKNPLPLDYSLKIALELADALTRAHHLEVIHRDIKPSNILIDEHDRPLLSDFGVARINAFDSITETGMAMGTLDYFAPEVFRGVDPSPALDIWAFGVVLFEMLAGVRPFTGNNIGETMINITSKDVPNLKSKGVVVPLELQDLIESMLVKDKEQRISSMRKVGATLEAILNGEVTIRMDSPHMRDELKEQVDAIQEANKASVEEIEPDPLIENPPVVEVETVKPEPLNPVDTATGMDDLPTVVFDIDNPPLVSTCSERSKLVVGSLVVLVIVGLLAILALSGVMTTPPSEEYIDPDMPVALATIVISSRSSGGLTDTSDTDHCSQSSDEALTRYCLSDYAITLPFDGMTFDPDVLSTLTEYESAVTDHALKRIAQGLEIELIVINFSDNRGLVVTREDVANNYSSDSLELKHLAMSRSVSDDLETQSPRLYPVGEVVTISGTFNTSILDFTHFSEFLFSTSDTVYMLVALGTEDTMASVVESMDTVLDSIEFLD